MVIKPKIEDFVIDGLPCRIRQYDDEIVFRYNISNLKIYNTTYAEMVNEIIARLKVITERLMLERCISYNDIQTPRCLDTWMCYTIQM